MFTYFRVIQRKVVLIYYIYHKKCMFYSGNN